ncbi:hypothetical protein ACFFLS_10540 [Flavobacterium procerum]|uniref:Lipocalin-like domain-containing protein n=1 Tax=Flavobacterium procerum TaxID=1455569 RepID=A0ABV6BPU5_9FLAO
MNSIKLIGFAALLFQLFYSDGLEKKIMGDWEYQYSIIDNRPQKLEIHYIFPVEKMIFEKCNDQKDIQKMPITVKELRKTNAFKNISCKTYNNGKLIDTYFPVLLTGATSKDTTYSVTNYGNRLKSDYFIRRIAKDTLIVSDGTIYTITGKRYTYVKHIYVKKR